jgi:MinD-like ATPase involved in chromosome partitioning or flagellar assembly
MQLDFEPGLVDRYGSLKDCVATGVYQRGLKRVAIDLDIAPSNLSVQLSEDASRHFSVDSLERYIEKTGDKTPIYYLVEKFISDRSSKKAAAVEQLQALGPQLIDLLKQAGLSV